METTLTAIEQYQVTEVELIYKTKVKASKRSQILHSRDIYEVFIQSWDKPHCLRRGWPLPETYLKRNYGIDDFIPPKSGRMYAASNINGNANDFSVYDICSKSNKDIVAQTLDGPLNTPSFDGDFGNTFMNHSLASPHKSLI